MGVREEERLILAGLKERFQKGGGIWAGNLKNQDLGKEGKGRTLAEG